MQESELHIAVIGSLGLTNELLAFFIREKTGATCDCYYLEDTEHLKGEWDLKAEDLNLLLFDCCGLKKESILNFLRNSRRILLVEKPMILLNIQIEDGIEKEALAHGARGFLYTREYGDRLVQSIETVLAGEVWLSRKKTTECLLSGSPSAGNPAVIKQMPDLTTREIEILVFLTRSYSNQMIGDKLCISSHTVKSHLAHIFTKIQVSNRRQAAQWAVENLRR